MPPYWNWTDTKEKEKCYQALTGNGETTSFTHDIWNELVDKIAMQQSKWIGRLWDDLILPVESTKMSDTDKKMTASRFNSAVRNIPLVQKWKWEESLGRKEIKSGDICYGAYFIYLTDALNYSAEKTPISVRMVCDSKLREYGNVCLAHALHISADLPSFLDLNVHLRLPIRRLILVEEKSESEANAICKVSNAYQFAFGNDGLSTSNCDVYAKKFMLFELTNEAHLNTHLKTNVYNIEPLNTQVSMVSGCNAKYVTKDSVHVYGRNDLFSYTIFSANVSESLLISADEKMSGTSNVKLSLMKKALVSEVDVKLASELEDLLVSEVEITIIE